MNKNIIEHIIIGTFLTCSLILLAWFAMSKPRVLILHSYDPKYSWVKDVNVGLHRVLDKRTDYAIRWYYLDTKRHPWPLFKRSAGIAARNTIDSMRPDVVIAIDDDAQQYVTRYYINDPHIKIVFAGVNNELEKYGFQQAINVTGILERIPLMALKETLNLIAEHNHMALPLRIRFLGDRSETVLGDEHYFRQFAWDPIRILDSRLVSTLDEWQHAVLEAKNQVDFLIVSNYRKILVPNSDDKLVPPSDLIAWTEKNSPVPVIGTNVFFTEENGMLAIGTSPYEQGEVAAHMAESIIDTKQQPKAIPYVISQQFVVAMKHSAMQRRLINLPTVYEAAARTGGLYSE